MAPLRGGAEDRARHLVQVRGVDDEGEQAGAAGTQVPGGQVGAVAELADGVADPPAQRVIVSTLLC